MRLFDRPKRQYVTSFSVIQLLVGPTSRNSTSSIVRGGKMHKNAESGVAKRRHPPKNQEFDFVAKTVLNVDIALLLEKLR